MPIDVKGIDKVNAKIASLAAYPKQQKQLIQAAGRRSLRPVVLAMRASIGSSNRTRTLYRSIGTKSARSTPTVIAGPRSGKSLQARSADGYYGRVATKALRDVISQLAKMAAFNIIGSIFGLPGISTAAGLIRGIGIGVPTMVNKSSLPTLVPTIRNDVYLSGMAIDSDQTFTKFKKNQLGF